MDPTKRIQTESVGQGERQQQLAPTMTEQVDHEELLEEYKLLIQYKNNQNKLETLIQLEKDQETLDELNEMTKELIEAVSQQEEKIKAVQNSDNFIYSTEVLQENYLGKLVKAYYEKDKKWYHSQITSVNQEEQMADIQFIGYKDVLTLHAIFIRQMPRPDSQNFIEGAQVECIYSDDGKYYPCTIEQVLENEKYVVKFKKYNNKETVTIYHLRENKKANQQTQNKKRQFDDLTEFKVPENLKILPNDNEKQRLSKKKKLKALKQQFKQAVLEKESQDKQSKWTDFKKNKGKNATGGSIFQTSDRVGSKVGVMNSGKGMTGFSLKDRLILEDNSHLSRQF